MRNDVTMINALAVINLVDNYTRKVFAITQIVDTRMSLRMTLSHIYSIFLTPFASYFSLVLRSGSFLLDCYTS
jgi:hypothetical protein